MSRSSRRKKQKQTDANTAAGSPESSQRPSVWMAYASAFLLWASQAPLQLGFLVWLAPLGWLWMVFRPERLDRRVILHLWLSGCVFWLANLQGIRLAFWPLYFGWLALGCYLAVYVPLFVLPTRLVIRVGCPLWLAAPTTWVGLEYVRSYLLTGYSASMLAHTQVFYPRMTQIADQLGAYGISFVIMLGAVSIYYLVEAGLRARGRVAWQAPQPTLHAIPGIVVALFAVIGTLAYGQWRLNEAQALYAAREPLLHAILVQENTPTVFDASRKDLVDAWQRYNLLSRDALAEASHVDLVVWPESTFTAASPWANPQLPEKLPAELARESLDRRIIEQNLKQLSYAFEDRAQAVLSGFQNVAPNHAGPRLLVGCDAVEMTTQDVHRFNSAIFVGSDGKYIDRYDKVHLVMFGEYIPLGSWLQWLGDLFGFQGATPGTRAKSFSVGRAMISPSICFETMMPRVILAHNQTQRSAGQPTNLIVNITNDSWFRGSSMLDHHLACSMLVCIENRKPMLVAANTGITAEIDGCGRLLQSVDRLQAAAITAHPIEDGRWGLTQHFGYPLGWACTILCLVLGVWGLRTRAAS